jgi:hygromycin-B 7''-O-kinase
LQRSKAGFERIGDSVPSLLPQILNRAHYKQLFQENSHWEKAVSFLVKKHQLAGAVQRGELGSHIVYKIGKVWIKLMAPLFAQDMAYELSGLRIVAGKLSVESPQILAEGELEGWPYVILSHVQGEAIRHIWTKLSFTEQLHLAAKLAKVTKEISKCTPDAVIMKRFDWNRFVAEQFHSCVDQQRNKQLPDLWLAEVKTFLDSFKVQEFETEKPVFLHADLTFDHFLVSHEAVPEVTGIIDMADCQTGHFEYELVAPCAFIFKGNAKLLREFLLGCGFSPAEMNQRFSEKLLAWSLLHRYFGLVTHFKAEMNECAPGDFKALAKKVYPLNA